jgi:cell division protein FtsQ
MLPWLSKRNRRKQDTSTGISWVARAFHSLAGSLRPALAVAALLFGAGIMAWALALSFDRPIAQVDVGGKFQRVAPVQIEEAIAPFRGAGFLSADLDALRTALEAIAWVDRVRVERRWPDSLHVFITEHVPAARWGERGLMNTRGELFLREAHYIPPELPQLLGPEGTESQVAQLYLETFPRLLAIGMRLTRVELDPRGAWQLQLANGVIVRLGRQDTHARLERFLRVAGPLIAARAGEVSYVDLRYSNGFAVGWNVPTRVAHGDEEAKPDA